MIEIIGICKDEGSGKITDYICRNIETGYTNTMPKSEALNYAKCKWFTNASLGTAFGKPYVKIDNEDALIIKSTKIKKQDALPEIDVKLKRALLKDAGLVVQKLIDIFSMYKELDVNFGNQESKYFSNNEIIGLRINIDNKYRVIISSKNGRHHSASLHRYHPDGDWFEPLIIAFNAYRLTEVLNDYFIDKSIAEKDLSKKGKTAELSREESQSLKQQADTIINALEKCDEHFKCVEEFRLERYKVNLRGEAIIHVRLNADYSLAIFHGKDTTIALRRNGLFNAALCIGKTVQEALDWVGSYKERKASMIADMTDEQGMPYGFADTDRDDTLDGAHIDGATKRQLLVDTELVIATLMHTLRQWSNEKINFGKQDSKFFNKSGVVGARVDIDNKYRIIVSYEKDNNMATLYRYIPDEDWYSPIIIKDTAQELSKAVIVYFDNKSEGNIGVDQKEVDSLNCDLNRILDNIVAYSVIHKFDNGKPKKKYYIDKQGNPTVAIQDDIYKMEIKHGGNLQITFYKKDADGFAHPLETFDTLIDVDAYFGLRFGHALDTYNCKVAAGLPVSGQFKRFSRKGLL